jgi:hypothetical protein
LNTGSVEHTQGIVGSEVPAGKEWHWIFATNIKKNPAIVGVGNYTRGTIYTFCEEILGIDPMYVFTDCVPEPRSEMDYCPCSVIF